MSNNTSPADAAWNTHRGYTDAGQRIAAAVLEDGRVAFVDVDRQIDGITIASVFDVTPPQGRRPTPSEIESFLMKEYDYLRCTWGLHDPEIVELRDRLRQAALGVQSRSELI